MIVENQKLTVVTTYTNYLLKKYLKNNLREPGKRLKSHVNVDKCTKNKDRRENVNKCQKKENWPGKCLNITKKVVKTLKIAETNVLIS